MLRQNRTDIYTNNIRFGTAAFLVAAALLLAPASADARDLDRFGLWSACGPIDMKVFGSRTGTTAISLAKDTIETAVRSRLRAARLYNKPESMSWLFVTVDVVGGAFHIQFDYSKPVTDHITGIDWAATTWKAGVTGTHGENADFILARVAGFTDKFIDEYLRVNADACE